MGSKGGLQNGRAEPRMNGYRSPDHGDKLVTPVPNEQEIETPGSRDYDQSSLRPSRNSMLTPGDRIFNTPGSKSLSEVKRFTGKSTLKNPFG